MSEAARAGSRSPRVVSLEEDGLDLQILRGMQLVPGRPVLGVDPLIPAARIAAGLGVSRNTVRVHLDTWRNQRFLLGFAVIPNPDLFGARLSGAIFWTATQAARSRLQHAVDFSGDGFCSTDFDSHTWVVFRERDSFARWQKFLGTTEGIRLVSPFIPLPFPPCQRRPDALDWKLFQALRSTARPRLSALARKVGAPERTVSRRYRWLLREYALFAYPVLDLRSVSGVVALAVARVARGTDTSAFWEQLELPAASVPTTPALPYFADDVSPSNPDDSRTMGWLLWVDAAATAAQIPRALRSLPGVVAAEVSYPGETRYYPQLFDQLLERRLSGQG